MTTILLGVPFLAVLTIILVSVGVRPHRALIVWLVLLFALGLTTTLIPDTPAAQVSTQRVETHPSPV